MVLDWKGAGVLGLIAAGVLWYASRKAGAVVEGAIDGVVKFGEALTFSADDLGPGAELTERAQLSRLDYIERGYLEILPDGSERITAEGEGYIRRQGVGQ
ncbi:MAG: hypothetical protein COB30_015300 [Ectothiorhodospiraceae bacterium]|nr:hypothetical protein [Ectothiorhodospiraceae bacterium]